MDYARTLFVKVNMKPIQQDAQIVTFEPTGTCVPTTNASEGGLKSGTAGDISGVTLVARQNTTVYLKLEIKENNDGRYFNMSSLTFNCSIQTSSKRGNYYFSTPEIDEYTINIILKDEESIQQMHIDEINKYANRIASAQKKIEAYDKVIGTATTICTLCQGAGTVNTALASFESLLGLAQATSTIAGTIQPVTGGVQTFENNICGKAIGKVCKYITCSYTIKATESLSGNKGLDGLSNAVGYQSLGDSMNPYKSYIVAAATLCIPAVVYHYKVYNGIECNYLDCISQQYVKYGQDIYQCQTDKAYSECVFFYGGLLDGIPVVSMIRDVAGTVAKAVKDPVALTGLALPWACKLLGLIPNNGAVHGGCVAVQDAMRVLTITDTLKAAYSQIANLFDNSKDPSQQCDAIVSTAKQMVLSYDAANPQRTMGNYPTVDFNSKTPVKGTNDRIECTGSQCFYIHVTFPTEKITEPKTDENGKQITVTSDGEKKEVYEKYEYPRRRKN